MIRTLWSHIPRSSRTLGAICLLLGLGMLIACLWPFHAPKNTVAWSSGPRAVVFGRYGLILGTDSFTLPGSAAASSCTLELWLQPDPARSYGTILAFYSPENPRQFSIDQLRTGLALRSAFPGDPFRTGGAPSYTHDVFDKTKPVFVTITSGEGGTHIYVDGALRKVTPGFRITNKMLSGKLVAGTAAVTDDGWRGQMRGLAVYSRELSPPQVLQHYTSWTRQGRPEAGDPDDALALYLFQEGMGDRIRSAITRGSDLSIPERYFLPAKRILSAPTLEYGDDIVANIIGFMPFGFALCGYLIRSNRVTRAVVITILICGAFSLLVESLQAFLPTRDSDMTDVITNILGGAIGALLFRWGSQRFEPRARA